MTSEAGNFLQQRGGGFAWHERQERNFAAGLFDDAAFFLVERFQGVISAFDVDIGCGDGEKSTGGFFRENANGIHALQRRQNEGAVLFVVHRAIRTFQLLDRVVAADADEQEIAEVASAFEIRDVAEVKDIETAVGDHETLAASADIRAPGCERVPGDQLVAKIHR